MRAAGSESLEMNLAYTEKLKKGHAPRPAEKGSSIFLNSVRGPRDADEHKNGFLCTEARKWKQ